MATKKVTLKDKGDNELYPKTAAQLVQVSKDENLVQYLAKIITGATPVGKATTATNADNATNATNANTSKKLYTAAYGGGDLNTFTVTDGSVEYRSIIPNTAANMPDAMGYQNSVMIFGLHDNGATAQMFFAKDKPLYYRSSQTGEWQQIATTEDVDNIEIGGTNLILNSGFSQGTEHWSLLNHGSLSAVEGVATFTLEAVANGQGMILTSPVDIVSGQQYTVSFDVRSEDVQALNYCFLIGVGVGNVSLSGLLSEDVITPEWQRIKRTFTASVSGTYKFGFGIQKLTGTEGVIEFQFKKFKIEKGNKATDWSPAPEDIVNGIKIDTRNLISNGKRLIKGAEETDNYNYITIPIPVGAKVGDTFTFNCGKIENIQGSPTGYDVYLYDIVNNKEVAPIVSITAENRAVTMTSVADAEEGNLVILLYLGKKGSTAGNEVYFYDCTLVKGNKPMLLWQPSVEDIQTQIDGKLSLSGGTLTGDLTAPSFKKNLTSGTAEAVMAYPVNISWGNDLNGETYLKAGMYQMSSKSNTLNQPSATGYGNVITVKGDAEVNKNNAGQIYLDSNGVSSKAYIRAGQVLSEALAGYHITDKTWREVRFMDDLVTTSHIAKAAITPEKIQTSIALNGTPSMTVEPTTSSPDKTIASVGLVKEAVDGIEVGGTNLLRYIKDDGSSYWEAAASVVTINGDVIKGQSVGYGYPRMSNISMGDVSWEANTRYVLSFWARGEGGYDGSVAITDNSATIMQKSVGIYTSTWKRYVITFTTAATLPTVSNMKLYFYCGNVLSSDTTSYLELKYVKLEKGDKATDWSPAPEDVEAKIEAAKPTIFLQTLQPSATEVKEGDIWIIQ